MKKEIDLFVVHKPTTTHSSPKRRMVRIVREQQSNPKSRKNSAQNLFSDFMASRIREMNL